jgi:hypothetical protein
MPGLTIGDVTTRAVKVWARRAMTALSVRQKTTATVTTVATAMEVDLMIHCVLDKMLAMQTASGQSVFLADA